jgi:D-alanyl-D-alanine carboxypeptidase
LEDRRVVYTKSVSAGMKHFDRVAGREPSRRWSGVWWALICASVLLGACEGSPVTEPEVEVEPDPGPDPARLVTIAVLPVPDPLSSPGDTVSLTAVGRYDDGSEATLAGVAWSSTNASVGTVDDRGVFTAVGSGEAEVIARLVGLEGRTTVRVEEELRSLRLTSPGDTAFSLGIRMRFRATVLDANGRPATGSAGTLPISWSSRDTGVATVDGQGRVTPVADGSTVIIAEAGALRAQRELHVDGRVPLTIDLGTAEALQWALEDSVSAWGFPGGLAAVSFPGGGLWLGAAGQSRPQRQMSPELEAYFASVTKTLVGAVVHQLIEEGRLSYGAAIGDLLPQREHIDPGITVEQLLGHTSGLYDYVTHGGGMDVDALLADPDRLFTPGEILTSFVGPPRQAPGISAEYSNTNSVALARIIEAVTGRSFHEEIRRRLLDPLQLTETYFPAWEEGSNNRVTGYLSDGTDGTRIEVPSVESFAGPSGGMISTVSDMARWSRLLFAGDVVSPMAAERLRAAESLDASGLEQFGVEFLGISQGAFINRVDGTTFIGHGGTFPHTQTAIAHSDVTDLSVAVVVNQNDVLPFVEGRLPTALLNVASAAAGTSTPR